MVKQNIHEIVICKFYIIKMREVVKYSKQKILLKSGYYQRPSYIKHGINLGSIWAVTNEMNDVISAQDYDMWELILCDRNYDIDEDRYKFMREEGPLWN